MLQIPQTRIISEDVTSSVATEEYSKTELIAARENFWQYRITMNPRLILREKWFPRSLAIKLRKFWDDFKAGKRPVMLLETPPQHGKSLSVINFIAWAVGHDPELPRDLHQFQRSLVNPRELAHAARARQSSVPTHFFPTRRSKRRAAGARCATTTSWNFSTPTATFAIPPCSARSRVRRSIRGQWSALEREEKIKFWPERDRNNSRPGAYEVGVEHGIVSHLANASGQGRDFDEHRLNFMLSVIKGIEPRNQLEAMLAAQMAAVHMASMTFAGRLAEVETIPQQDSAERAFNKLMRCRWRHSTVTGVAPSKRSHCNMFQSPRAAR